MGRRRFRLLLGAAIGFLFLIGNAKASFAGQNPVDPTVALGTNVAGTCNTTGRSLAVRSDGVLLSTTPYQFGVATSAAGWTGSNWGSPTLATTSRIIDSNAGSNAGWAIAANGSASHLVNDVYDYRGTSSNPVAFDSGTPTFELPSTSGASAYNPDVLVQNGTWILYTKNSALKLAWSSNGTSWSIATLQSGFTTFNGAALFAWSGSHSTDVGILYESGSSLQFKSAKGGSTITVYDEGTVTGTGSLVEPSAVSSGNTIYAVALDSSSGIVFKQGTLSGGSLTWATTTLATSGNFIGGSCQPTASIGLLNGNPAVVFERSHPSKPLVSMLRVGSAWGTKYVSLNANVSCCLGDVSIARNGYSTKIPFEYEASPIPGTGANRFFDAIEMPTTLSGITMMQTLISPNGDGYNDTTTFWASSSVALSSADFIIKNPSGTVVKTGSCSSGNSLASCTWDGTASISLTTGTYTATIHVVDVNGWGINTLPASFSVDVNVPTWNAFSPFHVQQNFWTDTGWTNTPNVYVNYRGCDAHAGLQGIAMSNTATVNRNAYAAASSNDCEAWQNATWTLGAGEGTKTVTSQLVDLAKNVSTSKTSTISVDTTLPTGSITLDGLTNGFRSDPAVSFNLTQSDPVGGGPASGATKIAYSCTGAPATWITAAPSGSCTAASGDGVKTVQYQVQDLATNISSVLSASFTLDTTAPLVSFAPPATADRRFTVNWAATDVGVGVASFDVEVKRDDEADFTSLLNATTQTSTSYSGTEPHSYTFRVRARDLLGNLSAWVTRTITISYDEQSILNLGDQAVQHVCDATTPAGDLGDETCKILRGLLSLVDSLKPNPTLNLPANVAVVSSGIACSDLPPAAQLQIVNCSQLADPVGYGTWATSVMLQLNTAIRIESFDVFNGNTASDALFAQALADIQARSAQFDVVLLAFPPANILDPTSWALNQKASVVSDANGIGSLFDVVTEALVTHPYTTPSGQQIIGLPLNAGLRSQMFTMMDPRQRAAVDAFAARTATWGTIRDRLKTITAAGVPIVVGAGEGPNLPTQSIVGVAALPEVITVGPAYLDAQEDYRLSPAAARGPAPDQTLKPDLLALSQITGLLPTSTPLGALADSTLGAAVAPVAGASNMVKVNAGWSVPAAAQVAVYAGDYVRAGLAVTDPTNRVAVVRGLLQDLASNPAKKRTGTIGAAPWEQGAGVLPTPSTSGTLAPLTDVVNYLIPLTRPDIGTVKVHGSATLDVHFWEGGASLPIGGAPVVGAARFLGPNDAGSAIEANYAGRTDVQASILDEHTLRIVADSGLGGLDVFQGGMYCMSFTIQSIGEIMPSDGCETRDREATFRSDYLYTDGTENHGGERTEDETFILTPSLPIQVGPIGDAFKFLPLDPTFIPISIKTTNEVGKVLFDDVVPGFYRLIHLGSYAATGTYTNLDDPSQTPQAGLANYYNDTWVYAKDPATNASYWEDTRRRAAGSAPTRYPPGRFGAAATWDSYLGREVVFGGQDIEGKVLGDTWTWDGTDWTKKAPTASPSARTGAAMYFDPRFNLTILFGGKDAAGNYLNDFWSFNGTTWAQGTLLHYFTPRAGASIVYDSLRSRAIIFGGSNASGPLGDTWTWDGTQTNGWQAGPSGPSARYGQGMAFDETRGVTVLFGGKSASGLLNDTWELAGSPLAWTQMSFAASAKNPPKSLANLTYLDGAGPGGAGILATVFSRGWEQVWHYDGTWTQDDPVATGLPFSRAFGTLVYDPVLHQGVLVGGLAPKTPTLGMRPGSTSFNVAFPARTPCVEVPSPLGPLTGGETLLNPTNRDENALSCLDRDQIAGEWGHQLLSAASDDTFCTLGLATSNITASENIYCGAGAVAVPTAVMTRYVDLIKTNDWQYCGVLIPDAGEPDPANPAGFATDALSKVQDSANCQQPSSSETTWNYQQSGSNCDPDNSGSDVTGTYGFRNPTGSSDPDLMLGILRYHFTIPDPAWTALLRVNLSYDIANAQVAVLATTGDPSGSNFGPAAGGMVVPATSAVTIDPAGSIATQGNRGTVTTSIPLWPAGATSGDLYVIFTPTTWEGTVQQNLAHATICKPSIELSTWAKMVPTFAGNSSTVAVDLDPNADLYTRQLIGPAQGPYPSWTRQNWNPQANNGLGAWQAFAAETETAQVDYQLPKDWDPTLIKASHAQSQPNPGGLAYAQDVRDQQGQSLLNLWSLSESMVFDPGEGVTLGTFGFKPIATSISTVDGLESAICAAPTLCSSWSVNGRFHGVMHVPDKVTRTNPQLSLVLARIPTDAANPTDPPDGSTENATPSWVYQVLRPWAGQQSMQAADPTANYPPNNLAPHGNTRYPFPSFVPYQLPANSAFPTNRIAFTLHASTSELFIEVESPATPEPVSERIRLDCGTPVGVCT